MVNFMKGLIVYLLIFVPYLLVSQQTYIPDDKFEQALIDLGLDTPPLNDSVPSANIDTVTILEVGSLGISDLTGIEEFVQLNVLNCSHNPLQHLNVVKNIELKALFCTKNLLESINVSNNTKLYHFRCDRNKLNSLDISKNIELQTLWCNDNLLLELDLQSNEKLEVLRCWGNDLTYLDLSNNLSIRAVACSGNNLRSLDLTNNTELIELHCQYNQLTYLNIQNGNNKNMVGSVAFAGLEATNNPDLECIQVDDPVDALNKTYWKKDDHAVYSEDCGYTSVEESNYDADIFVYPNPAEGFINIKTGSLIFSKYLLLNFLGEQISSGMISHDNMRIDISHLTAGIYVLMIENKSFRIIKN